MIIINASYQIMNPDFDDPKVCFRERKLIENAARTCYQSFEKESIDDSSAQRMISNLTARKHDAPIEFGSDMTVKFICDRAIANELARHRLCSFTQESTRYCNYSNDKFENQITVIKPFFLENGTMDYHDWLDSCATAERVYFKLLANGRTPQEARSVLPMSLKTELNVKANYREWRHILDLRCSDKAHPQIRELMVPLANELKLKMPEIFGGINTYDE